MEVMRLFQVILAVISFLLLNQCGVPAKKVDHKKIILNENYMPDPKFKNQNGQYTDVFYSFNPRQFLDFRFWNLTGFSSREQKQHKDAVYFALDNAEDFEVVSWYSDKRNAGGKIRVVFTHPVNAGICRDYQVQLHIKKRVRAKTLTACKHIGSLGWSFRYWDDPGDEYYFN